MRSLYSEVYIKTVFAITAMSREKLFHTGNARTGFKSQQIYVVRAAVSHSKRVEMGVKSIEMS